MRLPCGCCKGTDVLTPVPEYNRPGLRMLRYRAGTHSSFLQSMVARLSDSSYPELSGLTTRDPSDPSLAVLDAWATVADVLTFYQERIANEGFLRTATERRSVLELSRLVGYTLRPGVASSVYLAYLLEKGYSVEIAAGERVLSLPAPGERPQPFETSEPLQARAEWNAIRPRMTRPQDITYEACKSSLEKVYFKGISNNLKPNDLLVFVFEQSPEEYVLRRIREVNVQADGDRTEVLLDETTTTTGTGEEMRGIRQIINKLSLAPSLQPAGSRFLARDFSAAISGKSDVLSQALARINVMSGRLLYSALEKADFASVLPALKGVYVFRQKAAMFGYNAPRRPPVAQFTMDPATNIYTDTEVEFTDTSTGAPTNWHWDFGDGNETNEQNPTHTFTQSGSFTVSLVVTNEGGSSTVRRTITVTILIE